MTDADSLFGIMASLGKKEYSVQALIKLAKPLGIAENSVRTTLHRMAKKGILNSTRQGKSAYYSFAHKGLKISKNVSMGFSTPNWEGWSNQWQGIIFSIPQTEKPLRYKIRTKLELYRFASLYPGFWIRPLHKIDKNISMSEIESKAHCDTIQFQPEIPFSIERIQQLWNIEGIHQNISEALKFIEKEIKKIKNITPESAFKEKIKVGEYIVSVLFKDPLLPDIFLPKNWKGPQLRNFFFKYDKAVTKRSEAFLAKIFKED